MTDVGRAEEKVVQMGPSNVSKPGGRESWTVTGGAALSSCIWRVGCIKGRTGNKLSFLMLF